MKLFITILFILALPFICLAQEPKGITLDESTAQETTIIAKEVRLKRLIIDVADDGSFDNSRITVVAMIGLPSESKDAKTDFTLFTKVVEQEIYSGTLGAYSQELDKAVSNSIITSEEKTAIIAGLIEIYKRSADGFATTANILQANGKLLLKAKKVSQ